MVVMISGSRVFARKTARPLIRWLYSRPSAEAGSACGLNARCTSFHCLFASASPASTRSRNFGSPRIQPVSRPPLLASSAAAPVDHLRPERSRYWRVLPLPGLIGVCHATRSTASSSSGLILMARRQSRICTALRSRALCKSFGNRGPGARQCHRRIGPADRPPHFGGQDAAPGAAERIHYMPAKVVKAPSNAADKSG